MDWSRLEDQWGAWLDRAGSLRHAPVSFRTGQSLGAECTRRDAQVMKLLSSPERRYRALEIHYSPQNADALKDALRGTSIGWNGIQELTLNNMASIAQLMGLPHLQSLSLNLAENDPDQSDHFSGHHLRYPSLVSLHLSGESFETLATFGCIINDLDLPSLKELIINIGHFRRHPRLMMDHSDTSQNLEPQTSASTHAGVERLVIDGPDSLMFLPSLSLPSLKALEVWRARHGLQEESYLTKVLTEFCQRSTSSLHILALDASGIGASCLARLTPLIPSKHQHHVEDCHFFLHLEASTTQTLKDVETMTNYPRYGSTRWSYPP
jgi:hypothetical protein